jgi:transposase-like protein
MVVRASRVLTPEERQEAYAKIRGGRNVIDVAEEYGLTKPQLRYQLRALIGPRRPIPEELKQKWRDDYIQLQSIQAVAKKHGVTYDWVGDDLREQGLLRPKGRTEDADMRLAIDLAAVYLESGFPISLETIAGWAYIKPAKLRTCLKKQASTRELWQSWIERSAR